MNDQQEKLVTTARSFIGIPYKYAVPEDEIPTHLDCSSFTRETYKAVDIEIPRSTIAQATKGATIADRNELEVGDLIFFRGSKGHYNDEWFPNEEIYIGHVAMYTGDDKAIHASHQKGVAEEKLDEVITSHGRITMIKRML